MHAAASAPRTYTRPDDTVARLPREGDMNSALTSPMKDGSMEMSTGDGFSGDAGKDIVGSKYDKIRPTQSIVNHKKVDEYAKRLRTGEKIPPVQVIEIPGKGQYIINGHHRYVASLQTGIPIEIRIVQNQGPIGMPDWSGTQWKEYISEEQFWGD